MYITKSSLLTCFYAKMEAFLCIALFVEIQNTLGMYLQSPYRIPANSFCRSYSFFFNLEIVVNSNRCCKFQVFLLNKLIFCCVNYSMAETIQGEKLFSEIWYIFVPIILQILSDQIYCQNFAKLAFSCIFRSTGIRSRSGLFSNSYVWIDRRIRIEHHSGVLISFNLKLDFNCFIKNTL